MTRMTQSISLVLIGSSLILASCVRTAPKTAEEKEKEREEEKERPAGRVPAGGHRGGVYYHPTYTRGNHMPATSGSRSSGVHAPSRSGGFGSSGHMVGS